MEQLNIDEVTINQIREHAKILNGVEQYEGFVPLYGRTKKQMARAFAAGMKEIWGLGLDEVVPPETLEFWHTMTSNGGPAKPATAPVDNLDAIALAHANGTPEERMLAIGEVMRLYTPATPRQLASAVMHEVTAHVALFEKLGLIWTDTDGRVNFK